MSNIVKPSSLDHRIALINAEGWEVESRIEDAIINGNETKIERKIVWAYGQEFPLSNPISIYMSVYRKHTNWETRLDAMLHAHHILWPERTLTCNYWQERIFAAHCERKKNISLAGGGGIGKTQSMADAGAMFWIANPTQRAVIVASTTIDSLKSRIFGYIVRCLKTMTVEYPFIVERSLPPKIHPAVKDDIHGIYAIAANKGDDEEAIKNWIGRHPEDALLLILDEAPDLPIAIMPALSNLDKGLPGGLQTAAIGNSNSKTDLHGAFSTPKVGWENINPKENWRWETTQPDGICLYFNPYESPAIHETDPVKKEALSRFLMTEEKLVKAEQEEGVESEKFWRFTMGYWKDASSESTVVSEAFLKEYNCTDPAHFSGQYPLVVCAGLDPAFSVGGDKCILRLGVLGHTVNGLMCLDFRGNQLVFDIKIKANTGLSAELQIADNVIEILRKYTVPLHTLCIDASGAGRGLADIIQLRAAAKGMVANIPPTKIFSTVVAAKRKKNDNDISMSCEEQWMTGRKFVARGHIKGLDNAAYVQLYSRLLIKKNGKDILEPKTDYKKRMSAISGLYSKSPDEADGAMLCLQSAIIHHGFFLGQEIAARTFKTLTDEAYYKAVEQPTDAKLRKPFELRMSYAKPVNSLLGRKSFFGR